MPCHWPASQESAKVVSELCRHAVPCAFSVLPVCLPVICMSYIGNAIYTCDGNYFDVSFVFQSQDFGGAFCMGATL